MREERARLEATIGLVKSSLGKDETLSYRAASEVARAAAQMQQPAANGRRGGAWSRSSSLRLAASIVALVGGGFLGGRMFVKSDSAPVDSRYLASVDGEAPQEERDANAKNVSESLKSLGYLDSTGRQPTETKSAAPPALQSAAATEAERKEELAIDYRINRLRLLVDETEEPQAGNGSAGLESDLLVQDSSEVGVENADSIGDDFEDEIGGAANVDPEVSAPSMATAPRTVGAGGGGPGASAPVGPAVGLPSPTTPGAVIPGQSAFSSRRMGGAGGSKLGAAPGSTTPPISGGAIGGAGQK
ncbi:MAG TPA: hypothetical protein VM509_12010, partial [Planctomycetota bacterium]|nr:hypothetical protein [Planctomycetota bacterium]